MEIIHNNKHCQLSQEFVHTHSSHFDMSKNEILSTITKGPGNYDYYLKIQNKQNKAGRVKCQTPSPRCRPDERTLGQYSQSSCSKPSSWVPSTKQSSRQENRILFTFQRAVIQKNRTQNPLLLSVVRQWWSLQQVLRAGDRTSSHSLSTRRGKSKLASSLSI